MLIYEDCQLMSLLKICKWTRFTFLQDLLHKTKKAIILDLSTIT